MTIKQRLYRSIAALGTVGLLVSGPAQLCAQTAAAIDNDDIGGVVTGPNGPEGGVWVIAETNELPTKYAKMVVTDDQGRYVIPDLPTANYNVWVRGYGLIDSPKLRAKPGQHLDIKAVAAPNEAEAAHYYPAIYWYSMMKIPDQSQFGGKSNIPEKLTQVDWLKQMKNIGCIGCHQLGQESTRTIPAQFGSFESGEQAWMRRVQSGQSGEQMTNQLAGNFGGAPFNSKTRSAHPEPSRGFKLRIVRRAERPKKTIDNNESDINACLPESFAQLGRAGGPELAQLAGSR